MHPGIGTRGPRSPPAPPSCTTFDGRALAIVRPIPGEIEIRVSAEGCQAATAMVTATEIPSAAPSQR